MGVAALVAEAYASHEAHTRQQFAQDLAETFLAMRPTTDHRADQGVARGMEACARVALRMAGIGVDRMAPDATGYSRTIPDGIEQSRTFPNAAERSGTVRDVAGSSRTVPDDTGRCRTAPDAPAEVGRGC